MRFRACVAGMVVALALSGVAIKRARAQASAVPNAQVGSDAEGAESGRTLLNAMVTALGGEAWLNRQSWIFDGRTATFYKGQPEGAAPQFEEYCQVSPFRERIVTISHYGVLVGSDHRDVADVWTNDNGYEITYKGSHPLPAKDVEEYRRRRRHSLDVIVLEWLKQPGVLVTYDGAKMVERHRAQQISILSASNDAVVLELDEGTHLPLSLSFEWRDPVYKDWNTDVEEFADYHAVQGIMTPYSLTALHNGDMTEERFLTKVVYNVPLAAGLFDPNRPLEKRGR